MEFNRRAVELIDLQPFTANRRRLILRARGYIPEPQHRPLTAFGRPVQVAVRIHATTHINHLIRSDHRTGRCRAQVGNEFGRLRAMVVEPLHQPVFNTVLRIFRRGESQHGNIPVKVGLHHHSALSTEGSLRQGNRFRVGGASLSLAPDHHFHRPFRRNPRATRARPTGAVVKARLQPQTIRFRKSKLRHFVKLGRIVRHGTGRYPSTHIEKLKSGDTHRLHRFQVFRDARLRNIAVHPVPPRIGPRTLRRRLERFLQMSLFS